MPSRHVRGSLRMVYGVTTPAANGALCGQQKDGFEVYCTLAKDEHEWHEARSGHILVAMWLNTEIRNRAQDATAPEPQSLRLF